MIALLNTLPLKRAFEWGAGNSTEILANHPGIETMTSVDHDPDYLDMVKEKFDVDDVNFIYEPDERYYSQVNGDNFPYDIIFVDGKDRVNCLRKALSILSPDGVVILHDAERKEYEDGIKLFKHAIFTDNGNTAVLTNDDKRASTIRQLLSSDSV